MKKFVVARKIIIDHRQKNNLDPASITITKKLIMSVKVARQKYQDAIEEEKKNEKEREQNDQPKILNTEIRDVEKGKECISQVSESLDKEFIEIIQRAEGKDDTTVRTSVIKANGLKRKSEENRRKSGILEKPILNLELKKQKLCHK